MRELLVCTGGGALCPGRDTQARPVPEVPAGGWPVTAGLPAEGGAEQEEQGERGGAGGGRGGEAALQYWVSGGGRYVGDVFM